MGLGESLGRESVLIVCAAQPIKFLKFSDKSFFRELDNLVDHPPFLKRKALVIPYLLPVHKFISEKKSHLKGK